MQCNTLKVPARKFVHVILDNYAASTSIRKESHVNGSTGTRASPSTSTTHLVLAGSNAVEGFFAKPAAPSSASSAGVFRCVVDLQATINNRFVAQTNHDPKPFTWTADPDKIIARCRAWAL